MGEKHDDEEEFTLEELRLGHAILRAIYLFSVLCVVLVTAGVAVAGYFAWPAFFVIPAGAVLIFAARVGKRYFRNIVDGLSRDLVVQTEFQHPVRPANDFVAQIIRVTGGSLAAVAVIMLCVASFWYLVGFAMRWLTAWFG